MGFGVFIHRSDSTYDDRPAEHYQFPGQYLGRVQACIGTWILYYEPSKVADTRGYFAVAKVSGVIPDSTAPGLFLALIEPGSYLDFINPVPFSGPNGVIERGLLNEAGRISGRAQSAVRPISIADFNRIVSLGINEHEPELPRVGELVSPDEAQELIFEEDRDRTTYLLSRVVRDRLFRRRVLQVYDKRCAVTGLKLINGGGRAEVDAAHIRPVEANGPDIITNGIALSGTAHWMFDRGLISFSDDFDILVSRQVNDPDTIRGLINKTGKAIVPLRAVERPQSYFLGWHREKRFKL